MEATKARGEAVLSLGDRKLLLRPAFIALERIEEALGIGILDLCARWRRLDIRFKDLSVVVYHFALEGSGPGERVDRQEIGRLLMDRGVEQMMLYAVEVAKVLNGALSAGSKEVGAAVPN
jgi:hypothetical protein